MKRLLWRQNLYRSRSQQKTEEYSEGNENSMSITIRRGFAAGAHSISHAGSRGDFESLRVMGGTSS
jgi:hypothetical protein